MEAYNQGGFNPLLLYFMTIWGVTFTAFTVCFSLMMYLTPSDCVKKTYMILFGISISLELMITLGFWPILRNIAFDPKTNPAMKDFTQRLSMAMDHSLPLAVLLLDFAFNRVPINRKHWWIVAAVGGTWCLMDCIRN